MADSILSQIPSAQAVQVAELAMEYLNQQSAGGTVFEFSIGAAGGAGMKDDKMPWSETSSFAVTHHDDKGNPPESID